MPKTMDNEINGLFLGGGLRPAEVAHGHPESQKASEGPQKALETHFQVFRKNLEVCF